MVVIASWDDPTGPVSNELCIKACYVNSHCLAAYQPTYESCLIAVGTYANLVTMTGYAAFVPEPDVVKRTLEAADDDQVVYKPTETVEVDRADVTEPEKKKKQKQTPIGPNNNPCAGDAYSLFQFVSNSGAVYQINCNNAILASSYDIAASADAHASIDDCLGYCDNGDGCVGVYFDAYGTCYTTFGPNFQLAPQTNYIAFLNTEAGIATRSTIDSVLPEKVYTATTNASVSPDTHEDISVCDGNRFEGQTYKDRHGVSYQITCNHAIVSNNGYFIAFDDYQSDNDCLAVCDKTPTCVGAYRATDKACIIAEGQDVWLQEMKGYVAYVMMARGGKRSVPEITELAARSISPNHECDADMNNIFNGLIHTDARDVKYRIWCNMAIIGDAGYSVIHQDCSASDNDCLAHCDLTADCVGAYVASDCTCITTTGSSDNVTLQVMEGYRGYEMATVAEAKKRMVPEVAELAGEGKIVPLSNGQPVARSDSLTDGMIIEPVEKRMCQDEEGCTGPQELPQYIPSVNITSRTTRIKRQDTANNALTVCTISGGWTTWDTIASAISSFCDNNDGSTVKVGDWMSDSYKVNGHEIYLSIHNLYGDNGLVLVNICTWGFEHVLTTCAGVESSGCFGGYAYEYNRGLTFVVGVDGNAPTCFEDGSSPTGCPGNGNPSH